VHRQERIGEFSCALSLSPTKVFGWAVAGEVHGKVSVFNWGEESERVLSNI